MKWRLTFGDPRAQEYTVASQTIEIPAGDLAEKGWVHPSLMKLDTAVAIAEKNFTVHSHVGWSLVKAVLVRDEDQVVKWEIPYPIARLAFDPTKIKKPGLRKVWADPIARTIWMAVKAGHLTEQHFDKECLAAATAIRRARPTTVAGLKKVVRMHMRLNAPGPDEELFWKQFLPYVIGTKQFGYETVLSSSAQ